MEENRATRCAGEPDVTALRTLITEPSYSGVRDMVPTAVVSHPFARRKNGGRSGMAFSIRAVPALRGDMRRGAIHEPAARFFTSHCFPVLRRGFG